MPIYPSNVRQVFQNIFLILTIVLRITIVAVSQREKFSLTSIVRTKDFCLGGVDKPSHCDAGLFYDKSKLNSHESIETNEICLEHGCQWPKDVPHCKFFFLQREMNFNVKSSIIIHR